MGKIITDVLTKPSTPKHRQRRFLNITAISHHLQREPETITKIDPWKHVIHVVGKGISTFVSYADLPPIIDQEFPTEADRKIWRKRWKRNSNIAPQFWLEFYCEKIHRAKTVAELEKWQRIITFLHFALSPSAITTLELICQKRSLEIN